MSRTDTCSEPAVLVVEDEALQRLDAVATVEAAGFQAIGVSNADEAISILESRDDIRAMFTDDSDTGLDGWSCAHSAREEPLAKGGGPRHLGQNEHRRS